MEFSRIGEHTIKCVISEEEIYDLGYTCLLYTSLGSGKGEDVDKMRNAAHKAREKYPNLPIEGEIQFDAAVAPRVARDVYKRQAYYGDTHLQRGWQDSFWYTA